HLATLALSNLACELPLRRLLVVGAEDEPVAHRLASLVAGHESAPSLRLAVHEAPRSFACHYSPPPSAASAPASPIGMHVQPGSFPSTRIPGGHMMSHSPMVVLQLSSGSAASASNPTIQWAPEGAPTCFVVILHLRRRKADICRTRQLGSRSCMA